MPEEIDLKSTNEKLHDVNYYVIILLRHSDIHSDRRINYFLMIMMRMMIIKR